MIINNIKRARRALFSALGFIALFLCGAALLGLGLAESAEGAGIRTGSAPAQILPVADEAGAPEMVADSASPSFPNTIEEFMEAEDDCHRRDGDLRPREDGGIFCDTSISPSAAQSVSTMTVDFQDDISNDGYGNPDVCTNLGGTIQIAPDLQKVCSEIDKVDTFCIVDSREALPCRGLFKHVRLCNGGYNRPAWDISFCAPKCSDDKFACGAGCESGGLAGPVRVPRVAPGYTGEVFRVSLTMDLGKGRVSSLAGAGFDARVYQAAGKVATVHILSPLPAVSTGPANMEYAVTLRAGFSCAGRKQEFGALDFAYTITALPPLTIRLTREWLAPNYFATLTLDGLGDISYSLPTKGRGTPRHRLQVEPHGGVGYGLSLPQSDLHTLTVKATSPGRSFLGVINIAVEITFAGPPNAWRMPMDCRAPDPYASNRLGSGCGYDVCGLDNRLRVAVTIGDVATACMRITAGANVNHTVSDSSSKSILFSAVERGDAAMVSILAYNGADVNYRHVDSDLSVSDAPLHVLATRPVDSATEAALEKIAQALVENGADVNARDADGATYLYLAASGENASGMRAVLQAGANPNLTVKTGEGLDSFALLQAVDKDLVEVVSILIEFKDDVDLNLDVKDDASGLGALHLSKSKDVAGLLLNAGVDVNLRSSDPLSPGVNYEANLTPLEWHMRYGRDDDVANFIREWINMPGVGFGVMPAETIPHSAFAAMVAPKFSAPPAVDSP